MTIRITAIRLSGGNGHEHIVRLWWTNPGRGGTNDNSRAELVSWIESGGVQAYVEEPPGSRANVGVVTPSYGPKYLRTHADGKWTNNLLALPHK